MAELGIIIASMLGLFALGWTYMPAGWLTATTGAAGTAAIALDEAMQLVSWGDVRGAVPPEHAPWVTVMVLALTVAARFRNKGAAE